MEAGPGSVVLLILAHLQRHLGILYAAFLKHVSTDGGSHTVLILGGGLV